MIFRAGSNAYELDEAWGQAPQGYEFHRVSGVAVDQGDRVYLFNLATHQLMIFDPRGKLLKIWGHRYENAHGVHIGPDGSIYIADRDAHVVLKYSPEEDLLLTLGTRDRPSDTGYSLELGRRTGWVHPVERAAGPFNLPTGIAVTERGDIFVSDGYGNCRVHKFDARGQLLKSWGTPGKAGPGEFHMVHGIALDAAGRVLVCDRRNGRLQVFDQEGEFLTEWTGFRQPSTVAVGPDGTVCVAEYEGRLTILNGEGEVVAQWDGDDGTGAFVAPHGVAIDSAGDIYVGDVGKGGRIKKLVRR